MKTVWFETHATSLDNEAGLASGHFDVDLSPRGVEQARELGERYVDVPLDLVVASDLRRAWRTAAIAFGERLPIVRDRRLRECDYGELTRAPVPLVEARRAAAVTAPFPGGESYAEVASRVAACLAELSRGPAATVLLIGHRATFYALEHLLSGTPLETLPTAPWTWQPGWRYVLRGAPVTSTRTRCDR